MSWMSQYSICQTGGQTDSRTDRENCDSNTVRCITCSHTVKCCNLIYSIAHYCMSLTTEVFTVKNSSCFLVYPINVTVITNLLCTGIIYQYQLQVTVLITEWSRECECCLRFHIKLTIFSFPSYPSFPCVKFFKVPLLLLGQNTIEALHSDVINYCVCCSSPCRSTTFRGLVCWAGVELFCIFT